MADVDGSTTGWLSGRGGKMRRLLSEKGKKEIEAEQQRREGCRVNGLSPSGSQSGCNLTSKSS